MSEIVENKTTVNATNNKQEGGDKARWYVVHTYSGYENKVKTDLEKTIENRKLQEVILDLRVPVQDEIEVKNGVKKTISRKLFPGYVFVYMFMNDETWYIIRNTRGVTGFVGPESKPVPLTEAEIRKMGFATPDKESKEAAPVLKLDAVVGDQVEFISGVWEGNSGEIKSINEGKQTVTISVQLGSSLFDVETSFADVQKV
ncbi:MAG: transcription termination/antitermination factor NusG [Lachnospiraceae bacterium]|nr:transcription termination/antitermination factor NusG [Lachnospiraceae bacterium]